MKLLYVLAVLIMAWMALRSALQNQAERRMPPRAAGPVIRRTERATDTVACPRCGVYLPADRPSACDCGDCPYPRRS